MRGNRAPKGTHPILEARKPQGAALSADMLHTPLGTPEVDLRAHLPVGHAIPAVQAGYDAASIVEPTDCSLPAFLLTVETGR